MKKARKLLSAALLMMTVMLLTSCGSESENKVFSVDDLEGKTIGVQLGTTGDIYVSDYEGDDAGTKIERFNKGTDAIQSLKSAKVDAVVIDEQPAKAFVNANNDLKILDEEFTVEDYAICVAKNNTQLKDSINKAIEQFKSDGTLDSIINNYIGDEKGNSPYETKDVERKNGKLVMATNVAFEPYEYYENGKATGIDVELGQAIADYLGMEFEVVDMEFDSIITAVQSGKANVGIAGMTVTEDRLKNIDFTESYTTSKQVIVVRDNEAIKENQSFASKFKNDFVKDNRYQYLVKGLCNTLLIAACSALLGILIGFLIAIVRSCHDKNGGLNILNALAYVYLTVIRGTPTMVQVLIMYFIIFGTVNVNKVVVAIIAFGINSGAYVAEIFRSGIMSIDDGQSEAARSLGLTFPQTMLSIILPQAFKNVLPALANEFIVLLKETSISGYIGLQDLTKGADIIRSITYDPYLPLFGIAIIYLVMVMILSYLVKRLERRLRTNERR